MDVASGTGAQLHGSQGVVAMGVPDRIMIMLPMHRLHRNPRESMCAAQPAARVAVLAWRETVSSLEHRQHAPDTRPGKEGNLEKVVFGFFVLLAATLNFGFF